VPSTAVPIAKLDPAHLSALSGALGSDPLGGYAPAGCAYDHALSEVENWSAPPEFAEASRSIVFLTSAVPSVTSDCRTLGDIQSARRPLSELEYADLIVRVARATLDTRVKTFVVGVPGSEQTLGANYDPLYQLSELAAAGGSTQPNCISFRGTVACPDGTVPILSNGAYCVGHAVGSAGDPVLTARGNYCHHDLTQGDLFSGLQQALQAVQTTLAACAFPFPRLPGGDVLVTTQMIGVYYQQGGSTTTRLDEAPQDDCNQGGQWQFSGVDANGMPLEIVLCPATCDMLRSDPAASIAFKFSCLKPL
jgi:hypothetical protein